MNRFDGEMGSVRGMRSLSSLLLLAATLVFAQADIARGQNDYPNRPIQLVVTVPPGGAADFVGRLIGAKLADALGQPVAAPAALHPQRPSPNRIPMATRCC